MYVTMFLFLCTAGTVLCCVRCRYRDELFRLQVTCCVVEELWSIANLFLAYLFTDIIARFVLLSYKSLLNWPRYVSL